VARVGTATCMCRLSRKPRHTPPPPHVQNMSFAAQPLRKAAAAVAAPVVRALNTSAPKLGGGGVSSGYNDYLHAKSMCVPPHPGTQSHVEEPCQSLHLST
jgi:hypothetical protein